MAFNPRGPSLVVGGKGGERVEKEIGGNDRIIILIMKNNIP